MTTYQTHTFATAETVAAATLQSVQDTLDAIAPIGSYLFAHMTPPSSGVIVNGAWLGCDGGAIARGAYPKLFATIGTVYGVGDGSTTFNLPDFRGRTPLVAAASGSVDAVLGISDGAALASRRPKHSHTINSAHTHIGNAGTTSAASATHNHNIPNSFITGITTINDPTGRSSKYGGMTSGGTTSAESPDHTHTITGSTSATASAVTAVGLTGMTDGPSFIVACTILIRAL